MLILPTSRTFGARGHLLQKSSDDGSRWDLQSLALTVNPDSHVLGKSEEASPGHRFTVVGRPAGETPRSSCLFLRHAPNIHQKSIAVKIIPELFLTEIEWWCIFDIGKEKRWE